MAGRRIGQRTTWAALLATLALGGCLAAERSDAELQQALAAHNAAQDAGGAADAGDAADGPDDAAAVDAAAEVAPVDGPDAAADAVLDATPDPGGDAVAVDTAPGDAAPEVVADALADAAADAAADAGADAKPDAGADAAADTLADAAKDAAPDSAADVAIDAVADAAKDTAAPPPCPPGFVAVDVDGQLQCAADVPLWGVKPLKQTGALQAGGDGSVSDAQSLLMWQASGAATSYSHAEAAAHCQAATTAGHSDWRLPTVAEWLSIVDYTALYPALTSDFTIADPKGFWAANANVGQASTHWYVWLNYGYSDTSAPTSKEYALCVRCTTPGCAHPGAAKAGAARFSPQAGGAAVLDALTGLTWQVDASVNGTVTWDAAAGVCQALTLAGGGWRVPNIAELLSIVDRSKSAPAIDTAVFPGTKSDWYWTATPWGGSSGSEAWFVQFSGGTSNHYPKANKHRLRCVK